MFWSSWYMYINLSYLDAAARRNNFWSYCSVSILPYFVGAQETTSDVRDYSAIRSLVYYRQCTLCYCMIFNVTWFRFLVWACVCAMCAALSVGTNHTLIETRSWKFVSTVPCGLSWDHRCELRVLLIPLQAKVASSVNSNNGSNRRLVCNKRQNSRRMALSPGCRFCIRCGWNGYKPSSCNV
jgi:hypothetical protein